jgi:DNA-binding NtrC family response regulator
MQSYLVVAEQQSVLAELERHAGKRLHMIPLRSVASPDDSGEHERLAAIVIQMPTSPAGAMVEEPAAFPSSSSRRTLEDRVGEAERQIIADTLRRNNERRQDTADELGISRVTLYNKMKKFGLL